MAVTKATKDVVLTAETIDKELHEPLQDVSLREYLDTADEVVYGKVRTRAGMVKLASLTSQEVEELQQFATRPDPRNGKGAVKFDDALFKNLLAARSLHKVSPEIPEHEILERLRTKPGGDPAIFANAAIKLSGFDEERVAELDRLTGFTG